MLIRALALSQAVARLEHHSHEPGRDEEGATRSRFADDRQRDDYRQDASADRQQVAGVHGAMLRSASFGGGAEQHRVARGHRGVDHDGEGVEARRGYCDLTGDCDVP